MLAQYVLCFHRPVTSFTELLAGVFFQGVSPKAISLLQCANVARQSPCFGVGFFLDVFEAFHRDGSRIVDSD